MKKPKIKISEKGKGSGLKSESDQISIQRKFEVKQENRKQIYDSRWMEEALLLAQRAAQEDEVPVGAIIVHQDQVIGRGYNLREKLNHPLAHAELIAIHEASQSLKSWRLLECDLYVTLEPCPMCLAACQQARLRNVYYGAQDRKGGALSLGYHLHEDLRTHHRFSIDFQETPACSHILSQFFKEKRTKKVKK